MSDYDFTAIFTLDTTSGRLFWKLPPKNHAEKRGMEAGYICRGPGKNKDYWQIRAFGRTFKRSRVVFHMVNGRWPAPAVDHINGDSLDDRPVNLRECTLSENAANSRQKERLTNLPRGVYLTRQGRFMARITKNGKTTSLGTFDEVGAALAAYTSARKEIFREYA